MCIPLKNAYGRSANGAYRVTALDCPVGSPCLSVGKRDIMPLGDAITLAAAQVAALAL